MDSNIYRKNREEFYSCILDFDYNVSDAEQFLLNWKDVIAGSIDNDYSPVMEMNDLAFLLKSTNGNGDLANEYLQDLILNRDIISDESWNKFINNRRM